MAQLFIEQIIPETRTSKTLVRRDLTSYTVNHYESVFHVSNFQTLGKEEIPALQQIQDQIVVNLGSTRPDGTQGIAPLRVKDINCRTLNNDPTVLRVVVTRDDDPQTEPSARGFPELHRMWEIEYRPTWRHTFVDIKSEPILVTSPFIPDPKDPQIKNFEKPASVPQYVPQLQATLTILEGPSVANAYMGYIGKINNAPFLDFNNQGQTGMWLVSGVRCAVALYQETDPAITNNQSPAVEMPTLYKITVTILNAGPYKPMTAVLGTPNIFKQGWDGLAYYTESGVERIPRNKDGEIKNAMGGGSGKKAQEIIVPLYEAMDFNLLGPNSLGVQYNRNIAGF